MVLGLNFNLHFDLYFSMIHTIDLPQHLLIYMESFYLARMLEGFEAREALPLKVGLFWLTVGNWTQAAKIEREWICKTDSTCRDAPNSGKSTATSTPIQNAIVGWAAKWTQQYLFCASICEFGKLHNAVPKCFFSSIICKIRIDAQPMDGIRSCNSSAREEEINGHWNCSLLLCTLLRWLDLWSFFSVAACPRPNPRHRSFHFDHFNES